MKLGRRMEDDDRGFVERFWAEHQMFILIGIAVLVVIICGCFCLLKLNMMFGERPAQEFTSQAVMESDVKQAEDSEIGEE